MTLENTGIYLHLSQCLKMLIDVEVVFSAETDAFFEPDNGKTFFLFMTQKSFSYYRSSSFHIFPCHEFRQSLAGNIQARFFWYLIVHDSLKFLLCTGQVASKVAVVLSISRPFWQFYVGLDTIYGALTYANKSKWPTYTHDDRDFRCDLICKKPRTPYFVEFVFT